MPINEAAKSAAAICRKLRALAAVLGHPNTTEHERANAEGLRVRLERKLAHETSPDAPRAGIMFRLGRSVRQATTQGPNRDWTDHAFRAGKLVRALFNK
jgi:hypothetical protein